MDCETKGCTGAAYARGLCRRCYDAARPERQRRGPVKAARGSVDVVVRVRCPGDLAEAARAAARAEGLSEAEAWRRAMRGHLLRQEYERLTRR